MFVSRFTVTAFACLLAAFAAGGGPASATSSPAGQDRGQNRWDVPPPEFQQIERQGFHDGIDGARKDFGNHRQPDVNNRDEFRRPNLPREQWEMYRRAFRRGYEQAAAHLWSMPEPQVNVPSPPPAESGQAPAGPGDEIRQRGFQDGMLGAMKDLGNNRRPDPNNRDEYRNPNVPYPAQDAYRDGFGRGYRVAWNELTSRDYYTMGWVRNGQVRERGYRDGFEGAIKDFGNNRPPDPNNRDEYRHPNVPPPVQDAYLETFRRGYERATALLAGAPWRH